MSRAAHCILALVACSSCAAHSVLPAPPRRDVVAAFAELERSEQTKPAADSLSAALDLLDAAVDAPETLRSLETTAALVDSIAARRVVGLDAAGLRASLAFRAPGGLVTSLQRFDRAYSRGGAASPLARPLVALGALALAQHLGDAALSRLWRERTGCVRSAVVVGPLDWAALSATRRPLELEAPGAALASYYAGIRPFGGAVGPTEVASDGCDIETNQASSAAGLRAVVVDAELARPARLWVGLTSSSAATVVVGGKVALERPFEAGGGAVTRFGHADVAAGRVRITVRLGQRDDGDRVVLRVVDEQGLPVATRAPRPGESAPVRASSAAELDLPARSASAAERELVASALLALGDARRAEQILEPVARAPDAPASTALAYARVLAAGSALPEVRRVERERDAFERALAKMPSSWEAAVGASHLAGQRRGDKEGRVVALAELARTRDRASAPHPMLDAFEAETASAAGLDDRAARALAAARVSMGAAPLLAQLEARVRRRVGREAVGFACGAEAPARDALGCFEALVRAGDSAGALREIERLRALRGSPTALRALEMSQHIARADAERALGCYDALPAGQRIAAALALSASAKPDAVRARLLRDLPAMADGPEAALSFRQLLVADAWGAFDEAGARLVAEDRAKPAMREAATLVLEHAETYSIAPTGVLTYWLYDLRRVSGTTDVDQGAQAMGALVEGRDAHRTLRKRIHKADGRLLEPDQASNAAQEHADLSQLEQGDYVEQLVAGVSLPGTMGQLVVDTPDLLPSRASLRHARVEVRFPRTLELARWRHPLFTRTEERVEGDQKVWVCTLESQPPRRMEAGAPKMEREVAVSFGTQTWANVGRAIGEALLAHAVRDPVVGAFAASAVGSEPRASERALAALVNALGKTVRVANGAPLSDSAAAIGAGPQESSARTILELRQGSRVALAHQALAALGVPADVVVAEPEPFAADPRYPPHVGRFEHPLLVVRPPLKGPGAQPRERSEVWLDLDVAGPPLPPGSLSPELRGRKAIDSSGTITDVAAQGAEAPRDDVDIALMLDARGDARGTFTMLLRGRAAQVLADAFEDKAGSDRRDMLRAVALAWVPWATVDEVRLTTPEGSWQFGMTASIAATGFARPDGTGHSLAGIAPLHVVDPSPTSSTIGATFAAQGARENALSIDTSFNYRVQRRIDLGDAWTLVSLPVALEVRDARIEASRASRLDGKAVVEQFALSLPTGTVEPSAFAEFFEKARRTDDAFLSAIRIAKNRTQR
jgi:hypothetical protein